jgi:2-methylisocitrate lyase-like PEP mutase family enzyme
MVRAVAPKPLNVLVRGAELGMAELADLGVRRVSVGGALAATGWAAMMKAARELLDGSFDGLMNRAPGSQLNETFGGFAP